MSVPDIASHASDDTRLRSRCEGEDQGRTKGIACDWPHHTLCQFRASRGRRTREPFLRVNAAHRIAHAGSAVSVSGIA
eukprot:2935390-Rhodomonas_salina.1